MNLNLMVYYLDCGPDKYTSKEELIIVYILSTCMKDHIHNKIFLVTYHSLPVYLLAFSLFFFSFFQIFGGCKKNEIWLVRLTSQSKEYVQVSIPTHTNTHVPDMIRQLTKMYRISPDKQCMTINISQLHNYFQTYLSGTYRYKIIMSM